MLTFVTSDLHLGSRHFLGELFSAFLNSLPAGAQLVLNGDIVDYVHTRIPPAHERVIHLLSEESRRRKVIWIHGNHDPEFRPVDSGEIEFHKSYALGRRLFITHGYAFDNIIPYNRLFIKVFRALHRFRVLLGAEPVHVAEYAKKWSLFYSVLRKSVMMNAIEYAKENGFESVTCGHTHFMEERVVDGIRYMNTGSWTERPVGYVLVDDAEVKLCEFHC